MDRVLGETVQQKYMFHKDEHKLYSKYNKTKQQQKKGN